jgi:hypothetical protein
MVAGDPSSGMLPIGDRCRDRCRSLAAGDPPLQPTLVTSLIHRLIPPSMSKPGEYATDCLKVLQRGVIESPLSGLIGNSEVRST